MITVTLYAKRTQKERKEKEKKKEKERRQKSLYLHRAGEFYFDNTGPELGYTPLSALPASAAAACIRAAGQGPSKNNPIVSIPSIR